MKRVWYVIVFYLAMMSGLARADETAPAVASSDPAVVNHPQTAWELIRAGVDYLQPGYDWIVVFQEGREPFNGVSASLYTITSEDIPLLSLRAGYGTDGEKTVYGSTALDLAGLASRYLPASVKGLSPAVLTGVASTASQYVRTGPVLSYSFDLEEIDWGWLLGAQVSF